MPRTMLGGLEVEVDSEGFLQEPEKWNKSVAEDIARMANVYPLTEAHWKVVDYIRNYYTSYQIAPPIKLMCKRIGFELSYVNQLFLTDPIIACRIAGLPKPTGCI